MRRNKFLIWLIITGGFILVAIFFGYQKPEEIKIEVGEPVKTVEKKEPVIIETVEKLEGNVEEKIIPEKVLLAVPFISQAPKKIWDALHEEACEEASLLMVEKFFQKKIAGTIEEQDKEIKGIVKYENKHKYGLSITLDELAEIAQDYSGMKKPRVEKEATIEKIKQELSGGRPVIIPAAGKLLFNPNFKNGGPIYHMLVIRGYDEDGFITNDPGTRKGEGFRYSFQTLFSAIHDWNSKDILNGEKAYLVFD